MILSVVIPTMNKAELLRRTLAALMVQDPGPDRPWELVVVNDGSTDHTADLLAETAETQPRLRVVSPPQNVGRARARNLGARAATGRWLLFIDDDIITPAGLLKAHLDLLERRPGCGVIGYAVTEAALIDAPHFHYLDSRGVARLEPGPAPARFFVTQNASVPREAFLAVGGFDEEFSTYGFEDMEVAFRMEDLAGVRFVALSEPVPCHVHHHTLPDYLAKRRECGRHSLALVARRHPGRIREMRLHHVIDGPDSPPPSPVSRMIRGFAASALGRRFPELLGHWPTSRGNRPLFGQVYFTLMNLAVLCCYRQGLSRGTPRDCPNGAKD